MIAGDVRVIVADCQALVVAQAFAPGSAVLGVSRAPDQKPTPGLAGRPDVVATPRIGGPRPEAAEHRAFDTAPQVGDLVQGRCRGGR